MAASGYLWNISTDRIVTWSLATTVVWGETYNYSLADSRFKSLTEKAFDVWEKVVNLDFQLKSDGASNDIRIGPAYLDGTEGSTLGECSWSYNPSNNFFTGAEIAIDSGEGWAWDGSDYVDNLSEASMLAVMIHEIGHAIGLGHEDVASSIMGTYSDPDITTLTSYDINLIRSLYGGRYTGTGSSEQLTGSSKGDTLAGNGGNDSLCGGASADALNGGSGTDFASYATAKAAVRVDLSATSRNTGDAKGDTYSSIEGLIGSKYGDDLTGNASSTILYGIGGNDKIYGLAGNDTLIGGAGADSLSGGTGRDYASYVDATKAVVAILGSPSGNKGDATGDTFTSVEGLIGSKFADALRGDDLANVLIGNEGNDKLSGAGGNDTLSGGLGADSMTGGQGGDVFLFNSKLGSGNVDAITDFQVSSDTIRLDLSFFAVVGAVGDLASAAFAIGSAAGDTSDRIVYNASTGTLVYDANGSASGGAVTFATLGSGLALTAAHFDIVA